MKSELEMTRQCFGEELYMGLPPPSLPETHQTRKGGGLRPATWVCKTLDRPKYKVFELLSPSTLRSSTPLQGCLADV